MERKETTKENETRTRVNPGWLYSLKTQGKIRLAPGFSFDSDSKVKLYEVDDLE